MPAIGKQKAAQAPAREPVFFAATNGYRLQASTSTQYLVLLQDHQFFRR